MLQYEVIGVHLSISDITNKYTVTVANKFDTLQEISETHSKEENAIDRLYAV